MMGDILIALLTFFSLLASLFCFAMAHLCWRLVRAEKSMTWKPQTCSKDTPGWVQIKCRQEKLRWDDEIWLRATRRI